MADFSAQWEGRSIEGAFPLNKFLGATEASAVFTTTHDQRNAAIKLTPADPQTADAHLSRWQDAQKLSHPNLIRIFSTGHCEIDGRPLLYIVMERAEEDLSQVLPDRSLTAVETREMLEPTLGALEYLHRQGFAHAHVKPSNIMAVEDRLKISSDGLLRVSTPLTGAESPYDPPERIASPAGDVWSLGVTLIEVLTQAVPVNGAVPTNLPEPFSGIARACLRRSPADRSTIPQISQLLAPSAPVKPVPRKKRYTPVGVIILLALVIITVAGVMFMHSETGAPATVKEPEAAKVPASEPLPPQPVLQPTPAPKQAAKVSKPAEEPRETAPPPEIVTTAPVSGIVQQPLPEIQDRARNSIRGRVRFAVKVDVGPSGNVTDAKIESPGASKYFTERALAAVRQWKFEPVSVNGSEVGQRWRVRFEFLKTGTKVQPQRVSPANP